MQYKKLSGIAFLLFCIMLISIQAQNYQISFTGSGLSTNVDSVQVLNIAQGTSVTVKSEEVLQLVGSITNIETQLSGKANFRIFPNPMTETSEIEFFNFRESLVNIEVFDVTGKIVIRNKQNLIQGIHKFEISGLNPGIYMVNVITSDGKYAEKLLSNDKNSGTPTIRYQGHNNLSAQKSVLKSSQSLVQMQYNDGERILFKGMSGNYSRIITMMPTQSQTINFIFVACTDADGNHYPVVTIGNQTWMAENLKYLPAVVGPTTGSFTEPLFYVSGYDGTNINEAKATANFAIYGVLYNWTAAMNGASSSNAIPSGVQGLCPSGWHFPSISEWNELFNHIGGESVAGGKLKEAGTNLWKSPNVGATNETGFTALPGGFRSGYEVFKTLKEEAAWYSATLDDTGSPWHCWTLYDRTEINKFAGNKQTGFSIRCVKD